MDILDKYRKFKIYSVLPFGNTNISEPEQSLYDFPFLSYFKYLYLDKHTLTHR